MKKLVVLLMVCFLMAVTANAVMAAGAVWTKSTPLQADVAVTVELLWGDVMLQTNKGVFVKASPCNPMQTLSTVTGRVPLSVGANIPVTIDLCASPLKAKNSSIIVRWHTKLDTPDSAFGEWRKSGEIENLGTFTTPICRKYIVEWEVVCGDICVQEAGRYDGLLTCRVSEP